MDQLHRHARLWRLCRSHRRTLLCKDDPAFNRITKYIQQMPSSDFKGETLYLRLRPGGWLPAYFAFYVRV